MRRALLLVPLLLAACGDPPSAAKDAAPAPPRAAPAAPVPFEAAFGDPELAERVLDAARTGRFEDLASLKLPPRCDRVRVAVRLLHDQLLGMRKPPPDRAQLLAAVDALARAEGGGSPKALGPLVAAWRTWDDAQIAAETELAKRYAAALGALREPKLDAKALLAPLAGAPPAPPMSAAAADLSFFRAAALLASAPDDGSVRGDISQAYDASQRLFDEIGWPGGFGSLADLLARRLLFENPKSFRAHHLADVAQAAYAKSGDELRASMMFLPKSEAAERAGDLRAAEYAADGARDRLRATAARGRELVEVFARHGSLAQMLGRQKDAARDLGRAWEESRWAALDAAVRVPLAERYATTLFILGRFGDAYDAAREGAKQHDDAVVAGAKPIEPARTMLDEIAAQAALESGRAAEAADLYRSAAARREKFAAEAMPDEKTRGDTDLLLAASAQAKSGDKDGAARAVAEVLARGEAAPAVHAHASSVFREAGRFVEAERELSLAETAGGPGFAVALTEERARLAAARGDAAGARDLFRKALARVQPDEPGAVAGWEAARVLLDWARMEMDLGRLFEASELAGRAVVELRDSGLEMELDRARKLFVDLARRRGMWIDAEKAASQRVESGPPGDAARREDALLDLLFVRIELVAQRRPDAEKHALEVTGLFDEGWRREVATRFVRGGSGALPAVPVNAPQRWRLVRDVAAGAGDAADLAKRCGAAEPEMRRRLAERAFGADDPRTVELRRRPDVGIADAKDVVTREDDAVLLVEPFGEATTVVLLRKGRVSARRVPADSGLADFWDACWVEPTAARLDAAAKSVAQSLFDEATTRELEGVKRLWISLPEPLGPLPFDLLPFGGGTLLDRFEVLTVNSLTEFAASRARRDPPMLSELASPYATLDLRNALLHVGGADPAARARLFTLIGESQNQGKGVSEALRDAKLALRKEWKPDPAKPPAVPPWAAFLLRGAP